MAYLLDANVFIQAKNLHYGFDFCPAFWDWIITSNAANRVFSIEKVGDELEAGNDDLATWAEQRGPKSYGGHSRDRVGLHEENQDPERLYRPWHQMYDTIRDVAARACAVRSCASPGIRTQPSRHVIALTNAVPSRLC